MCDDKIVINRFNTISCIPDSMHVSSCFEQVDKDFGPYVVDDSSFVPMSEAVKRVTGGTLSPEQIKSLYDFSNGKDTGVKVPVDRSHRFTGDIAEASEFAREAASDVQAGLSKAKADYDLQVSLGKIDPSTGQAPSGVSSD